MDAVTTVNPSIQRALVRGPWGIGENLAFRNSPPVNLVYPDPASHQCVLQSHAFRSQHARGHPIHRE